MIKMGKWCSMTMSLGKTRAAQIPRSRIICRSRSSNVGLPGALFIQNHDDTICRSPDCSSFWSLSGFDRSRSMSTYKREEKGVGMPFKLLGKEAEIDTDSESFLKNKLRYDYFVGTYRQAAELSLAGGGEKSMERHVKRHGKMIIMDRVKALIDDMDTFMELSLIGGIGMEYGNVPRASLLSGIGKVHGRYCLIVANDGAFKGGAIYPITLKKQLRAQEIAEQNRLPCLYLVDSAGAFLPLQADIFNPGGQGFYNEAVLSAAKIPQVAIVCGSCTAGGAYIPTMADEAVIVHKTGTIFLGGPPLVKAALGEVVSAEDLGGATVHCSISGCTDYFAQNESKAFEIGRDIVASLNVTCDDSLDLPQYDDPVYDINEIPGVIPAPQQQHEINMYQIIARLVDGSRFHEFKAMFGKSLLTGFAHIQGHLVGIIANQGALLENEAAKGAHFIQMCCERDIPLVFLQNTVPDDGPHKQAVDAVAFTTSLKSQARMLQAVSCAKITKITVIVGNGFGPAHYIMGGRAVSPNFLFAWPNARISIMEPSSLAQAVTHELQITNESKEEDVKMCMEKIERESSAIYGATRILNDGIILPGETRKVLSQSLSICKAYRPVKPQEYPVFRM